MGEKEQDYAMEWSKIKSVSHDQDVLDIASMRGLLVSNSKSRVAANAAYTEINKYADYLDAQKDNTSYPLNIDAYAAMVEAMDAKGETFKRLFDEEVITKVSNPEQDAAFIAETESRTSRNDEWIKGIKKDLHLSEVLNIMEDMINLTDY